jgi:hypothetical protein
MRKSDTICRFEKYVLRSTHLSFLCSPNYNVFEHDFLHLSGINNWLHQHIFVQFFLNLIKAIYDFF